MNKPVVISCRGGTPRSQLAVSVAEALGEIGAATAVAEVDEALRAEAQGAPVVALDGCESGCATQLLQAAGLARLSSLRLDEAGESGDAAVLASRLAPRLRSAAAPGRRRRARAPLAQQPDAGHRHTADDYLLAVDLLTSPVAECGAVIEGAPALSAHVSQLLGVTRPTAGEMLERLVRDGLLHRTDLRELLLTDAGRAAADAAGSRQRVLECFVTATLGYPAHEAFARARALATAFDDEAIERLRDALGRPERCPHGWPLDPAEERAERHVLSALSSLDADAAAVVVRLDERDEERLRAAAEAGLAPGERVTGADAASLEPRLAAAILVGPAA